MYRILFTFIVFVASVGCSMAQNWVTTWAAAQQVIEPKNNPPIALANETFRQIVQVSIPGEQMRLRLSNRYSREDLEINAVEIAEAKSAGASSDIEELTTCQLTFNGSKSVVIKAGEEIYADVCDFKITPRMNIAITIHYGKAPLNIITGHPSSRTTSYFMDKSISTEHWYTIESIDVIAGKKGRAIAVIGNSITDGRGSTTNGQNRWPDVLSERLLKNKATRDVSVLNFGIGGNCVVEGGLGPTVKRRYQHDIFGMSGVKYVILFEGVNDLGGARDAVAKADQIIEVYKQIIKEAHEKGMKVYGGTVMPFKYSFYDFGNHEAGRQHLNEWIRSCKDFDAVLDFDAVMSGTLEKDALNPIFLFENDWLHPNAIGYKKMGESINLKLFK